MTREEVDSSVKLLPGVDPDTLMVITKQETHMEEDRELRGNSVAQRWFNPTAFRWDLLTENITDRVICVVIGSKDSKMLNIRHLRLTLCLMRYRVSACCGRLIDYVVFEDEHKFNGGQI